MHSIVKYCFPFFSISRILRGTHRMELFVEVTNLTKGNTTWAHYTSTGNYPTSIRLSQQIQKKMYVSPLVSAVVKWCTYTGIIQW